MDFSPQRVGDSGPFRISGITTADERLASSLAYAMTRVARQLGQPVDQPYRIPSAYVGIARVIAKRQYNMYLDMVQDDPESWDGADINVFGALADLDREILDYVEISCLIECCEDSDVFEEDTLEMSAAIERLHKIMKEQVIA